MGDLKRLLEHCLEQIVNDRYVIETVDWKDGEPPEVEECWCYDECDGSGVDAAAGRCLACRLREAIAKEGGGG